MKDGQPDENDDGAEDQQKDPVESLDFPDGPGGILTDSDRVYLLHDDPAFSELEWSGDDNQKRWRIRQKIQNALHDFELISNIPQSELELILDDVYIGSEEERDRMEGYTIDDVTPPGQEFLGRSGWGDQYDHLVSMMRFAHRACETVPLLTFEHLVETAVRYETPKFRGNEPFTHGQRATNVDVDVSIDVDVEWEDVLDVDEIEAKLERGEEISREEVGELFLQGRLEPGDLGADDIDRGLFRNSGTKEYPALEPSKPSPQSNYPGITEWDDDLRAFLPDEMIEKVDWEAADRPEEAWAQLEEEYDDAVAYATEAMKNREAEDEPTELPDDLLDEIARD